MLESLKNLTWLGAACVTIAASIWGAATYLHGKKIEYQRSFNERQLEIVFLAAETVGELVAARTEEDWEKHKQRFWELYWGRLVLFETNATIDAMITLGDQLKETKFDQRENLKHHVFAVSASLRDFLKAKNDIDWRISFDTIVQPKGGKP